MKTSIFTFTVLTLALLISACHSDLSTPKTNIPVVINDNTAGVVKLSPSIVREPKAIVNLGNVHYEDGSYIMDFENDRSWDIELLAISSTNDYDGGVGVRAIQSFGITTYVSLNPLSEKSTVNNNIDWTLINGQDITMLTTASSTTNVWSDFKYLAVKEYDQNKNSAKFYWIKLKANDAKTGYEIDSYYK